MKGRPNTAEMVWSQVDKDGPNGCWEWTGGQHPDGYGQVSFNGQTWLTHRLIWTLENGPIPDGMYVCHNCPNGDNPLCCNPAHLWLGTNAENIADTTVKRRKQQEGHMSNNNEHELASQDRYLNIKELASIAGVTPETARLLVHNNNLPILRIGRGAGKGIHVRESVWRAFLLSRETQSNPTDFQKRRLPQ